MNLPNILTLSRFFLTCLFVIYVQQGPEGAGWALAIFTVAVVTDFFDGFIARRYELITDFGKLMDPVADKFLTLAAFFMLSFEGLFPLWMVVVVAAREILVTGSRIQLLTGGKVIPAEQTGKIKTVVQMATIFMALAYRIWGSGLDVVSAAGTFQYYWQGIIFLMMLFSVVLTVWSGVEYFANLPKEGE